eukprot:scaffold12800_cov56-Phaeocystis_antarctica.AAC.4
MVPAARRAEAARQQREEAYLIGLERRLQQHHARVDGHLPIACTHELLGRTPKGRHALRPCVREHRGSDWQGAMEEIHVRVRREDDAVFYQPYQLPLAQRYRRELRRGQVEGTFRALPRVPIASGPPVDRSRQIRV